MTVAAIIAYALVGLCVFLVACFRGLEPENDLGDDAATVYVAALVGGFWPLFAAGWVFVVVVRALVDSVRRAAA